MMDPLVADVRRVLAAQVAAPPPVSDPWPAIWRRVRRRQAIQAGFGCVAVFILGVGAWQLMNGG
jgi:hypothetical protein